MIYDIIQELRSNNSRLFKESVLQREVNNELLKKVLVMTLNPRINYYIKKFPKVEPEIVPPIGLEYALEQLMEKIVTREITGHAAQKFIVEIFKGLQNNGDDEVLKLVIGRDLKCGVSTSTANKIWPDLIPEQPYQRCSLLSDMKPEKINWKAGMISQEKLDGMFANIDINGNEFSVMSRNGSPFPTEYFHDIYEVLKTNQGYQHHGELIIQDKETGEILPREIGNGILNSLSQTGEFNSDKYRIKFIVWDAIPLVNVYGKEKYPVEYKYRYEYLLTIPQNDHVSVAETVIVFSLEEAMEHYKDHISKGHEGTILKSPDSIWKDGTSKDHWKFKIEAEVELKVVGYNAGKGKNEKTFGSLICRTSDDLLEVNVSGFSDEKREEIWNDIGNWVDKMIVTVRFNGIMHSEGKLASMFLPRFVEERLDKTEADSLQRAIEIFESKLK